VIDLGREICGDLGASQSREWLVTNGIGGYASGTVAGVLTRRYHGLLVAALTPPLGRTLLVAKVDDSIEYENVTRSLFTNRWADGTVDPHGYREIERFRLEGTTPVWTYACADALLEKRVWMEHGANTTYIRYRLLRARGPVALELKALVNYRDHHGITRGTGWQMTVEPAPGGLRVVAFEGAQPFVLLAQGAEAGPAHTWYYGVHLARELERGLESQEDHLHAGTFRATLGPGAALTLVLSAAASPSLNGEAAWHRRRRHEDQLLARWRRVQPAARRAPFWIQHLVLAADQFVVRRPLPDAPRGISVIAGYHWFGDWGRDTMISLPGLTLGTGRPQAAREILRTYARFVDQGMLPNQFPNSGAPEYNTVDAALWYIEAIRGYHAITGDDGVLRQLFPILTDIVARHQSGTRYRIQMDPSDCLLYAGEPVTALTWMDARVGNWVATPRIGKPVEVNALWYNALRAMAAFARRINQPAGEYDALAARVLTGFGRFWNEAANCCFDVLDGPDGPDSTLRPNQIFAVSLPESPLTPAQQRGVVDAGARHLLTSRGLRSLAPGHPAYQGRYGGDERQRDGAYHQGTVWGWLLGPFVLAHLRVYDDPVQAGSFLDPMANHLAAHGLGSLAEIFDGDPPFRPDGCIAQAWTVAEVLRAWMATVTPRRPRRPSITNARNGRGSRPGRAPVRGAGERKAR
jgi:predicted glycogen debranching enzyme